MQEGKVHQVNLSQPMLGTCHTLVKFLQFFLLDSHPLPPRNTSHLSVKHQHNQTSLILYLYHFEHEGGLNSLYTHLHHCIIKTESWHRQFDLPLVFSRESHYANTKQAMGSSSSDVYRDKIWGRDRVEREINNGTVPSQT